MRKLTSTFTLCIMSKYNNTTNTNTYFDIFFPLSTTQPLRDWDERWAHARCLQIIKITHLVFAPPVSSDASSSCSPATAAVVDFVARSSFFAFRLCFCLFLSRLLPCRLFRLPPCKLGEFLWKKRMERIVVEKKILRNWNRQEWTIASHSDTKDVFPTPKKGFKQIKF